MEFTLKEIKPILKYIIENNQKLQANGQFPVSVGLMSHPGVGKTSLIEQIAQELDYNYIKLNLSQITDSAEICGWPFKEHYVCKDYEDGTSECAWIPSELVEIYARSGWHLTPETRMSYAVPMWLKNIDPNKKLIVNLDDFSRAGNQVIQSVYELICRQEYLSWKLPPGTTLFLTSNYEDSGENVTSLDEAAKTRFINFDIKFDKYAYAEYAERIGIDGRAINFILSSADELMDRSITKEAKVNARNYTMFANIISGIPDWSDPKNLALILQIAAGCFLDEDGIVGGMFTTFIANKLDKLLSPEDLIHKDWAHVKGVLEKQLYDDDNYRADIASIVTTRFVNYSLKHLEQKGNSVDPISDRILKIVDNEKQLLSEDLLFNLIKTLNKKFPGRCNKLILNPKIAKRLM